MMPYSFNNLIYPYYSAYTMDGYQIVISIDNSNTKPGITVVLYEGYYRRFCFAKQDTQSTFQPIFSQQYAVSQPSITVWLALKEQAIPKTD